MNIDFQEWMRRILRTKQLGNRCTLTVFAPLQRFESSWAFRSWFIILHLLFSSLVVTGLPFSGPQRGKNVNFEHYLPSVFRLSGMFCTAPLSPFLWFLPVLPLSLNAKVLTSRLTFWTRFFCIVH